MIHSFVDVAGRVHSASYYRRDTDGVEVVEYLRTDDGRVEVSSAYTNFENWEYALKNYEHAFPGIAEALRR